MEEYYLGRYGIHPIDFWDNTIRENQLMGESKDFEHNRQHEVLRLTAWRIAVSFAGSKGMESPDKIWKTPYEQILGVRIKASAKPHNRKQAQSFVDNIPNMNLR